MLGGKMLIVFLTNQKDYATFGFGDSWIGLGYKFKQKTLDFCTVFLL